MSETEKKSVEELKQLITEISDGLKAIAKPVDEQLKRLRLIIDEEQSKKGDYPVVLNHRKWMETYRPDLLQDKKLMAAIKLWELLGAKDYRKKMLRRKTERGYDIFFVHNEWEVLRRILEEFVVDYSPSRFEINMGKSLLKELERCGDSFRFSARELSLVLKGMFTAITEVAEDIKNPSKTYGAMYDQEDLKDFLLFANSLLEKKVKIFKRSHWIEEKDDGTGEFKHSRDEKESNMIEAFGQLAKMKDMKAD